MKLFKGKFLRFMSGLKNAGQEDKESRYSGNYSPMESQVNFAVPKRTVLDKIPSPVQTSSPGILTEMISKISTSDPGQIDTFKICVDGKKLNAGVRGQTLGDVNLWGFEDSPNLQDRTLRLERELKVVESLKEELELAEIKDTESFSDLVGLRRERLLQLLQECIYILSNRLHDLRVGKVGQKIALEKLMGQVSGDWRLSRYGFAISGIRTKIFEIDSCTSNTLHSIDMLSKACSVLSGTVEQFGFSDTVQLGFQENFACLKGITEPEMIGSVGDNSVLSTISQRSDAWFSVRKEAVLTGSTCYKALGFDGLKAQKKHYETIFQGKEKEDPDEETLKRMMHGSRNEINAVATLVAKIMPVYFLEKVFFEEGCYRLPQSRNACFIVSPDGSLREESAIDNSGVSQPFAAVEIKCPYPGKLYTTQVQYKLPVYYVPQILSEMVALQVSTLLFVSYSEESTVLLRVEFDHDLWNSLLTMASDIYPAVNPSAPKRLHPRLKFIRKDMERFTNTNVSFVCEVQSVKAIQCRHDSASLSPDRRFRHQVFFSESEIEVKTSEFRNIAHNCSLCIKNAWGLSRQKATEVLVFLAADLDRIRRPESQYASPIAYAFKGYSMKTKVMRLMLDKVLQVCYENGMYCPVVSFDGQWYLIAIRDNNDRPLTVLQLQKDVFQEAKNQSKSALTKHMFNTNVVEVSDLEELRRVVDLGYSIDSHGKICGPITAGKSLGSKAFAPSIHVANFIRNLGRSDTDKKHGEGGEEHDENQEESTVCSDMILSALPDDVVANLDEETVIDIKRLEETIRKTTTKGKQVSNTDAYTGLSELFDTEIEPDMDTLSQQIDTESERTEPSVEVESETMILDDADFNLMLTALSGSKDSAFWQDKSEMDLRQKLKTVESMNKSFSKRQIQTCLRAVAPKLKEKQIRYGLSWPKYKIVDLFFAIMNGEQTVPKAEKRIKRRTPKSLKKLCQRAVSALPKSALNVIFVEYIFEKRLETWRQGSCFDNETSISALSKTLVWYCKPEYITERFIQQFALIDPHHILTNIRVKCCNTGIMDRGIHKDAWIKVAREGNAGLNIALVEDLVDRQSDTFAQATFSEPVEEEMIKNNFQEEAKLCRLIREWYSADDSPGISSIQRCLYRLNMRDWLLDGVQFNRFPPPGSHIRGVPMVMFEGLMTNIDRRLQLFSYVKKGSYNVRSLGSLEAENLFGQFQDLDPKGTGVIRPDDVPNAISTACELLCYRMDDSKTFYMHTSKAKVYPLHKLINVSGMQEDTLFLNPLIVNEISLKDHAFDKPERGKSKTAKTKTELIEPYDACSRGARTVRQWHRCDREKILPEKRKPRPSELK